MRHKTWTPYPMFYWRSNASCIETFVKLFCELNTTMPTGDRAIYHLEGLRSNPQLLLNMCWSILEEDTELELTQRHSSVWLLVKSTKKPHCMNVCAIRWIRPGCSLASGLVHRVGGIYFYDELTKHFLIALKSPIGFIFKTLKAIGTHSGVELLQQLAAAFQQSWGIQKKDFNKKVTFDRKN